VNAVPIQRIQNGGLQRRLARVLERTTAIERPAEAVDDASKQSGANRDRGCLTRGDDPIPGADASRFGKRYREQPAIAKTDDLDRHRTIAGGADAAEFADAGGRARRFHEQTDHPLHFARDRHRLDRLETPDIRLQRDVARN
jgi:hypothetical protein